MWLSRYTALLISAVPGFLYTVYRFVRNRQWNTTGLFLLGTTAASSTVDLLSGSAQAMLLNNVYYKFALSAFIIGTVAARKPISLYFAADLAYFNGKDRLEMIQFYSKHWMIHFQLLTVLFGCNYAVLGIVKHYLVDLYGVDGYASIFLILSCLEGTLGTLYVGCWLLLRKKIKESEIYAASDNSLQNI